MTKRRVVRNQGPAPAATGERFWAGSALVSWRVFCGSLWLAGRPAPSPAAGLSGPSTSSGPSAGSGRPGPKATWAGAPAAGQAFRADDAEVQGLVRGLREADSSGATCELVGR